MNNNANIFEGGIIKNAYSKKIYICDICSQVINPGRVVEIRECGLSFHPKCFTETSGPKMVWLMGCAETTVIDYDEQGQRTGQALSVRKPHTIRPDGTFAGPSKPVDW